jgi:pimeloyl-ACP methyl ester carboxylesterase
VTISKQTPVLLIHGTFSRSLHMQPLADRFTAAGYSCIVPSLPGHDPSDPRTLDALTLQDYRTAVEHIRSALSIPPILVGHSMGGLLAQQLAASGPCAALVCLATAPPGPVWPQLRSLGDLFPMLPRFLLGSSFRPSLSAFCNMGAQDLPAEEQRAVFETVGYESVRAYRAMVFGTSHVAVGEIRCPVLCITPGDDRMIPRRASDAVALRHKARHIVLDGRGHWLIAESGIDPVAGLVLDWLARI